MKALKFENIIVCGDFNINLLQNNTISISFCDNIALYDLNIVNKYYPTRFAPNCNPSLLDVMICSPNSLTIHFVQVSLGGNSNVTQPAFKNVYFRDFNAINNYDLYIECLKVNWNKCCFFIDVNDKPEATNMFL